MVKSFMPYIMFNGNLREAIPLYKEAFGIEVLELVTFKEGNFNIEEKYENHILNATIKLGEYIIGAYDMVDSLLLDTRTVIKTGNQVSFWIETPSIEK